MARFKHFDDITPAEQIKRWSEALRVMINLTPHERKKHFNMEFWGVKTECGTIACAAGHCGLDPWFKRQGFKLLPAVVEKGLSLEDYYGGAGDFEDTPGSDTVHDFFGYVGSEDIFYNDRKRPVTRVIKEIEAYINVLKASYDFELADVAKELANDKFYDLINP
jgi:hypothetical protein